MKYFLVILIIILFSGFLVWFGVYVPKEPWSTETIAFLVKKGEGVKEISINLKEQGLIRYSSLFRVYVLVQGKVRKLQAGEYQLSPGMSIPEIVDKLASGQVIKKTITIVEGWNLRDIAQYLEEKGIVKSEELERVGGGSGEGRGLFSRDFGFLSDKPKNSGLEGYLFPDTYEIFPEEGIEKIIERMLTNFDKKLTSELREEIISQEKTIFEIITMASMFEKEVKTLEDKKIVSGILWKRLEWGIPLQVDATISYITGRKTTKITKEELQIDSPYNTYRYRGLPLGPISNPGLESIITAIYPEESPYLYYLSTPKGKTIFSKTLREHNIAKAEYLK